LFAPFFVEFETINPIEVTVANPDRGGNTIGAVFDYSDSLGGDGQLDPNEMTTFKLWVFNDPNAVDFFIFANVFASLAAPAPIAKTTDAADPIKIYVNVKNKTVELGAPTGVEDPVPLEIPSEFALLQNYPNPFNPETTIRFQLPQETDVRINIYNIHGQLVRKLVSESREAGFHEIVWDARDDVGKGVPSGVYIYRIQADTFMEVRKLLLLR